jgi:hypothetical protein
MSGRMDWRKARLHGRATLDWRRELEMQDRAAKWLAAVERNQQEPRYQVRGAGSVASSTDGVTASSTAAVSW